jgi:hypothetical protein
MKSILTPKKLITTVILITISIISSGCDGNDIMVLITLPLAYYGLKYATIGLMQLLGKIAGKNFTPSQKSIKTVEFVTNDEGFLKEFANMIKNEGDFNDFIKRIQAPDGGNYDWNDLNLKGFQKYKTPASDIVEKLMMTDTLIKCIKINKLNKLEIQFLGNSLFYWITDEEFRKQALKIRNKFYPEMEEDVWGNTPRVSS